VAPGASQARARRAQELREFDALVREAGSSHEVYLRRLVSRHIKAMAEQDADDLAVVEARLADIDEPSGNEARTSGIQ
jgi:hypothetical protein